jgi:Fic family protein
MSGSEGHGVIGGYRTHAEPMQVVSGPDYKRTVHFEAPPSTRVPAEMQRFIAWFNASAPGEMPPNPSPPRPPGQARGWARGGRGVAAPNALSALTRAAQAHLYFECIHPFEDGNGRIGRALSEKALAQTLGQPSLIALAYTIERKRKDYYAALEANNKHLHITGWMTWFANTILEAQATTIRHVDFYVAKAKFYERFRDKLNERQAKAVARMFGEGPEGFKGGLSAENYMSIARTSRATATRDLQDLVALGALTRTGQLRHTRYALNLAKEGGR